MQINRSDIAKPPSPGRPGLRGAGPRQLVRPGLPQQPGLANKDSKDKLRRSQADQQSDAL